MNFKTLQTVVLIYILIGKWMKHSCDKARTYVAPKHT